ncbi:MAG: T9SS type A sorting domain-containing protein [Ignavibacteria bacterium]
MKKLITLLTFLLIVSIVNVFAQTPQYYNTNAGASINTYPWGQAGGQRVHWLILPHTMLTPTPAPPGNITTLYFYMGSTATATFTNLCIKLGQAAITNLPSGWYAGTMDTVYFRATATLSSTNSGWMSITLGHPFAYDTAKALIIDVQQCLAAPGTIYVRQSTGSGMLRNYGTPGTGCPINYVGQDGQLMNFGVDITPPVLWSVPELIYYRFHNNGVGVTPNFASAPVGTNPAPFTGVNLTSGGEFDTCIVGTGASGTNGVNVGWNCALGSSPWTISFWVSNLVEVVSGNPVYLFGDAGSTTFRCFYAGAAYPNNMLLRGPLTDIIIACPMPGSHVFHFVYDGSANVLIYMDGAFVSTNPRVISMPTGTGFRVAGYTGGAYSLNTGGLMDEFRLYSRALTAAEIQGTWNKELPVMTGIHQITSNIPNGYNLAQNYPNPFNPTTKISFSIPKAGNVKLRVFDMLGREVKILVNEFKNAGTYDVNFNALNLASGVYLYRIEAGDFKDVKKMTLVK